MVGRFVCRFNSIKVRLRHLELVHIVHETMFQFHKGTFMELKRMTKNRSSSVILS